MDMTIIMIIIKRDFENFSKKKSKRTYVSYVYLLLIKLRRRLAFPTQFSASAVEESPIELGTKGWEKCLLGVEVRSAQAAQAAQVCKWIFRLFPMHASFAFPAELGKHGKCREIPENIVRQTATFPHLRTRTSAHPLSLASQLNKTISGLSFGELKGSGGSASNVEV